LGDRPAKETRSMALLPSFVLITFQQV
jgi:hypothetical protein